MKNVPKRVFLQVGELTQDEIRNVDFNELDEVTWCANRVFDTDIEFVLAHPERYKEKRTSTRKETNDE